MKKLREIRNGFTLIELLVVVAIIAVLVSILLPALSNARERTRRVQCAGHLRQIGTAFLAYAHEYSVFPSGYPWPSGPEPFYMDLETARVLLKYGLTGNVTVQNNMAGYWSGIWNCPSNPGRVRGLREDKNAFYNDHHMIQTHLSGNPGYNGSLSPKRPEDPLGPIIADIWACWVSSPELWYTNHGVYDLQGYNQCFSDGHVKWFFCSEFQGDSVTGWTYHRANSSIRFYWIEKY